MGKTPSSSSTMAWWWRRSVVLQQGFAKHYERRGGREVGLRQEGDDLVYLAAPNTSSIYRGRGGAVPPSRVPSLVVAAAPKTHLGCGQGGKERGHPRVGLKAHLDLGFCPLPLFLRLGPWWGGVPAHLGLVPSHTWPMQPSGAGGPTWWTPGTLPVVPVHYR